MFGPVSFVIGLGLLSAAGIDKMRENLGIAAYNELYRSNNHLDCCKEEVILNTVKDRSYMYCGFDSKKLQKKFPNENKADAFIHWTFREWGIRGSGLTFEHISYKSEVIEALESGDYLSPYYAEALWLSQQDTSEMAAKVKEEVLNSPIIQRAWGYAYEDRKQIELWFRKWTLLGVQEQRYKTRSEKEKPIEVGKYTNEFSFHPGESRASITRYMADTFNKMQELKEKYISPQNESFNSNAPHFGIDPSPGTLFDYMDNIHIDEWDTYGLYKLPNGESCIEDAPNQLIVTEDQMREFWKNNKFIQHAKKEWEICQEFATKYDLSEVGLDAYDIMEYCSSFFGPKSTQLFFEGYFWTHWNWGKNSYKVVMAEKMNIKREPYQYKTTNIVNLEELRKRLKQERRNMLKSDEQFRMGYYQCIFYESLRTREDEAEAIINIMEKWAIHEDMADDYSEWLDLKFKIDRTECEAAAKEILSWFDQDWERKKGKPIVLKEKQEKQEEVNQAERKKRRSKPKRLTRNRCS